MVHRATVIHWSTLPCALCCLSPPAIHRLLLQFWRLFTNFFFFGAKFSLEFLFHMFFLVQYCRSLEEGSFRGRTADFFYMILIGATLLLFIAPFAQMVFLGSSLTFMMVYIWARRNPFGTMHSEVLRRAHGAWTNPQKGGCEARPAPRRLLSVLRIFAAHTFSALAYLLCVLLPLFRFSVRMSFLGLFTFTAPYLPWVLLGFSFLLGNDGQQSGAK